MNNKKIALIHNTVTPYRLPMFEQLAKKYDLTVYFCDLKTSDRRWSTSFKGYTFKYEMLTRFKIGILILNTQLLSKFINRKYNAVIIAENPENALTILFVYTLKKILGFKVILWSERINSEIYTLVTFQKSHSMIFKFIYLCVKNMYKSYRRLIYSQTDAFIIFSKASKVFLESESISQNRIFSSIQVFPMKSSYSQHFRSTKKSKNKVRFLYLGYLIKRKGVDTLINSFNSMKVKNAELYIIGSGSDEVRLKKLAGINKNIFFLGYMDGFKKDEFILTMDVLVLPTRQDAWGLVVNEALYFGLPVIVTNAAGASELVRDKQTGFIIEPDNENELREKMDFLTENRDVLTMMKRRVKNLNKSSLISVERALRGFDLAINNTLG